MRKVICDRCGYSAQVRTPEKEDWGIIKNDLDLCPKCCREYADLQISLSRDERTRTGEWLKAVREWRGK